MRTQKKRPGYQRGAPRSGCFSLSAAKIVLSLAMETSVSMDTGRNTCNSACDMRGRCINDKKIAAELHQTSRGPKCTPGPAGAGRAHSNRSTALLRAEMGPVSQSVSQSVTPPTTGVPNLRSTATWKASLANAGYFSHMALTFAYCHLVGKILAGPSPEQATLPYLGMHCARAHGQSARHCATEELRTKWSAYVARLRKFNLILERCAFSHKKSERKKKKRKEKIYRGIYGADVAAGSGRRYSYCVFLLLLEESVRVARGGLPADEGEAVSLEDDVLEVGPEGGLLPEALLLLPLRRGLDLAADGSSGEGTASLSDCLGEPLGDVSLESRRYTNALDDAVAVPAATLVGVVLSVVACLPRPAPRPPA